VAGTAGSINADEYRCFLQSVLATRHMLDARSYFYTVRQLGSGYVVQWDQTCDQEIASSTPSCRVAGSNSEQVVDTRVTLSASSITWYRPRAGMCCGLKCNSRLWQRSGLPPSTLSLWTAGSGQMKRRWTLIYRLAEKFTFQFTKPEVGKFCRVEGW